MGRRPLPGRAARTQSGKPPAPPPGGGGVTKARHDAVSSRRNAAVASLIDAIMVLSLSPSSGRGGARQVQNLGAGSTGIQAGGDVTITASNGSVAAWSINGAVNVGTRPPPRPIQWDTEHRANLSWKASTRNLAGSAVLLVLHTALLALAITVLMTGDPQGHTYASLALNPLLMFLHAHRLRTGVRERLAARTAYNPRCGCHVCARQPPTVSAKDLKPKPLPIWTWETREFTATCECPNHRCGAIATHHLRAPSAEDPALADGVVIRTCTTCGQEWTER